jgi:hypothetical protein
MEQYNGYGDPLSCFQVYWCSWPSSLYMAASKYQGMKQARGGQ